MLKNNILALVFLSLIIPQIALASWWNPFTWFRKAAKTEQVAPSAPQVVSDVHGNVKQATTQTKCKNIALGVTRLVYLEGEKYKTEEHTGSQGVIFTLFDGKEVLYSWVSTQSTGAQERISCDEEVAALFPKEMRAQQEKTMAGLPSAKTILRDYGKKQAADPLYLCEQTTGVDFTPPTNITFSDNCEYRKSLAKAMMDSMLKKSQKK
jgi:hypothetical protein